MEEIPRLEQSDLLSDHDPSESSLSDFFSIMNEELEHQDGMQIYYCKKVVDIFFYGPTSPSAGEELRSNTYIFDGSDYNEYERRFAMLIMGLWYIESGDIASANGVLADWEYDIGRDSQFYILSSRWQLMSGDQQSTDIAIEDAFEARKHGESAYFLYNISHVLWHACHSNHPYQGDQSEIPSEIPVMLDVAEDMIDTALNEYSSSVEFLLTKARISIEKSSWNEAEAAITEGRQSLDVHRDDYDHILLEFRILEHELDLSSSINEFNDRVLEIQSDIRPLEEKISKLNKEISEGEDSVDDLKNRLENNNTQFLQFLGFFSALLAVAVTSTQVATTTENFATGFRLILALTGALLISFGGFSTMFVSRERPGRILAPLFMILTGSGIIYYLLENMVV